MRCYQLQAGISFLAPFIVDDPSLLRSFLTEKVDGEFINPGLGKMTKNISTINHRFENPHNVVGSERFSNIKE
jgi:hypothetical protein